MRLLAVAGYPIKPFWLDTIMRLDGHFRIEDGIAAKGMDSSLGSRLGLDLVEVFRCFGEQSCHPSLAYPP